MAKSPEFDLQAAHNYFSTNCFNAAWDFIEMKDRTDDDNDAMIRMAQTSFWHWLQRDDKTDRHLSVGYWQLSRVYALAGKSDEARYYGNMSLKYSEKEEPFYKGYAYEALARVAAIENQKEKAKEYLTQARQFAEQVSDPDWKKLLLDDLDNIAL